MDPNELRQKKQECLDKAQAIEQAAQAEERDLTDEQTARMDALLDEADQYEQQAQGIEAEEQKAEQRRQRMQQMRQQGGGRQTTPSEPTDTSASVQVKEPEWTKDPNKGFDRPRDFFSAVLSAPMNPTAAQDERLKFLAAAGSDEQQVGDDAYGGFLVPEGMSPNMLQVGAEANPLAGRVTSIPMDSPVVNIPARVDKNHNDSVSGGIQVYRRGETSSTNSSRMEFEKVRLEANMLAGLAYVTDELMQDSPRSVAALIEAGFRDEFTSRNILDLLEGTGTGEPMGIANTASLIEITRNGANAIAGSDILKMRQRAWRFSSAIWLANHDTYQELANANISATNSDQFIFQPQRGTDIPDQLLGRPIFFTEYNPSLGSAGDLRLLTMSEYLYGLYQPLNSAESVHVRFDRHERAFKFWLRDAGAPWWSSALTPKKSTETLSPFVQLGTT